MAATLLDVEFIRAAIICILGNVLPIPFVLLFLKYILELFSKWKFTTKMVKWLEKKVHDKREQIDKYGYFGLVLFVGIPLPGTGAWTGSLVAALLEMDVKKAMISVFCGVLIAGFIMTILSYGLLDLIL